MTLLQDHVTKTRLRARYAETDTMGVVHHAAYVVWLELGRVEWLRANNMSYRMVEAEGVSLAVSALDVQYRSSAVFDDELIIETRLLEAKSRLVKFHYRVRQASSERLVIEASTTHTPVNRDGLAIRLPSSWLARLEPLISS